MWCERILGNISELPASVLSTRVMDRLDLQWNECRPVLKKRTRGGEEIRLLLPSPMRLRHGDILHDDGSRMIVVELLESEVMVAGPAALRVMAELTLELGNLHWPVELTETRVIFEQHESAMAVLENLQVPWSVQVRRFSPVEPLAMPKTTVGRSLQIVRSKAQPGAASVIV